MPRWGPAICVSRHHLNHQLLYPGNDHLPLDWFMVKNAFKRNIFETPIAQQQGMQLQDDTCDANLGMLIFQASQAEWESTGCRPSLILLLHRRSLLADAIKLLGFDRRHLEGDKDRSVPSRYTFWGEGNAGKRAKVAKGLLSQPCNPTHY